MFTVSAISNARDYRSSTVSTVFLKQEGKSPLVFGHQLIHVAHYIYTMAQTAPRISQILSSSDQIFTVIGYRLIYPISPILHKLFPPNHKCKNVNPRIKDVKTIFLFKK